MVVPRISVGLPVYNGERYLSSAIESLLAQDFEDFELIISDNASTDETQSICMDYSSKDKRVRYYRNAENIGATPNYNRVFELARGEFFKWAAHDDECHPSLLRRCVEGLERASSSVVLAYPQTDIIDARGEVIGTAPDRLDLTSERPWRRFARMLFYVQYGSPLWGVIRSDALRKTRRMVGCVLGDFVLLGELAMLGKAVQVRESLLRLREHAGNATHLFSNHRKLLLWCDPVAGRKKLLFTPKIEAFLEYHKSVWNLPLSSYDKWTCLATPLGALFWRACLRWSGPVRGRVGLRRGMKPEAQVT